MTKDVKIRLELFCGSRPKMGEPFSQGVYTYATNGHILVRVDKDPKYDKNEGPCLMGLPFDHDKFATWQKLPKLPKAKGCELCHGKGTVDECSECGGKGAIKWSNGRHAYEAECKSCNGDGLVGGRGLVCPNCRGMGTCHTYQSSILVKGFQLDMNYLERIKALTNPVLAFEPDDTCCKIIRFKFDGGVGLLMPMRQGGQ